LSGIVLSASPVVNVDFRPQTPAASESLSLQHRKVKDQEGPSIGRVYFVYLRALRGEGLWTAVPPAGGRLLASNHLRYKV